MAKLDKWQAQHNFWSGFKIPAYDERSVPDDATMPYITYQAVGGAMGEQGSVSASLWYRSNSWDAISKKADEIIKAIYDDVRPAIPIDNGYIKIRIPDTTYFAQRMDEPGDKEVRRIILTLEIEFLTNY